MKNKQLICLREEMFKQLSSLEGKQLGCLNNLTSPLEGEVCFQVEQLRNLENRVRGEYGSRESKRQSLLRKELAALALLQSGSLTSRKEELRHPCHVEALAETSQCCSNSTTMRFFGLRPQNDKLFNVTHLLNYINELKDLTTYRPNVFKKAAFTLAEMMVVMLIMTIVLAAMAPVITTRMNRQNGVVQSGGSSIWQWVSGGNTHAYFGEGSAQMALIGTDTVSDADSAKLIINRVDGGPINHILFKQDGDITARLRAANTSVLLNTGELTSQQQAVAIGHGAGAEYDGNGSVAIGFEALMYGKQHLNNTNTAIGFKALRGLDDVADSERTAYANVAIGENALGLITKGDENVAVGNSALYHNIEGSENTAVGNNALYSNTTGRENTAVGFGSLWTNKAKGANTAVGYKTLFSNNEGEHNTALGHQALYYNSTGNWNTAVGYQVLHDNTTGGENTAIGYAALGNNLTGEKNTAIGSSTCQYVKGSNKTCIGYNSGPADGHAWAGESDTVERIFIGSKSQYNNGTAVLEVHNPKNDMEHTSVIINGHLTVHGLSNHHGGTFENSDARLKNIGSEVTSGLDKIKQLKVFNYTFKDDKEKTPRVGVIAQDLQKVFPDAVTKGQDGYLLIRTEDMFYAMVNAIKELDAQITKMASEILKQVQDDVNKKFAIRDEAIKRVQDDNARLKQENKDLKEALKQVQKDNKNLEKRLNAIEAKLK